MFLGVTGLNPKYWSEDGPIEPSCCFATHNATLWINGYKVGVCDKWQQAHGDRCRLRAGDTVSVTLCQDRSLSLTLNDTMVTHIFQGLVSKPTWVVVHLGMTRIEVVQTGRGVIYFLIKNKLSDC